MRNKFTCPACKQILALDQLRDNSFQIFCTNPRCPSDVAQEDGGAGATEQQAYRQLCNTIDHETEMLLDPVEQAVRNAWAVAEHANDIEKAGGA